MHERKGVINGYKYETEAFAPTGFRAQVLSVQSLADLRDNVFPVAREALLKKFDKCLGGDWHAGVAFSHPVQVGIFLFDPGTSGIEEGAPGYRKAGGKLGNYTASQDVVKDIDPMRLAEACFDQIEKALKDDSTDLYSQGLGIQFNYFSPLAVNIGLEFGLRLRADDEPDI